MSSTPTQKQEEINPLVRANIQLATLNRVVDMLTNELTLATSRGTEMEKELLVLREKAELSAKE